MEDLGLDPSFWGGKRVLLTGHTGFKGAWLALWLRQLGADCTGLALAPEPGSLFDAIGPRLNIDSHIADVRDARAVRALVGELQPQLVLHLAAQALVLEGYRQPVETFEVNVVGTLNMLHSLREQVGLEGVLVVTSDKCYLNEETGRAFREDDALGGHDPYSASKACQEIAVQAYGRSFLEAGAPVATARAGNVIGGGDAAPDRLLPDILRALAAGEELVVRSPNAVRPWQHVLDPLLGYLVYLQQLASGGSALPRSLNFAGPESADARSVGWVVEQFASMWERSELRWRTESAEHVESRMLNLDAGLARRTLSWRPRMDAATALAWVVDWHRAVLDGDDPYETTAAQLEAFAALPPVD